MLSRKSLVTSVMLVVGYILVCLWHHTLKTEFDDLSQVTSMIAYEANSDKANFSELIKHTTKKKTSWRIHRDKSEREVEFIALLLDNPDLSETTYGQAIIKKYKLYLDLANAMDKNIVKIATDRAIVENIGNVYDSLNLSTRQEVSHILNLESKKPIYKVGEPYELEFQVLADFSNQGKAYYDVGDGKIPITDIPLVFYEKPNKLKLLYTQTNVVTGESYTYTKSIYP